MVLDIDKVILISDIHMGIRSNNLEWNFLIEEYFNNWFIPLLNREVTDKTAVFVLGDIFDSRATINIKVMNTALQIVEDISKICPVYMICGNHDLYNRSSTSINSLKMFNYIPNVKVYEEPKLLKLKNCKSILLMPWRGTPEEEQEVVEKYDANYLFCHTDIKGFYQNQYVISHEGNDFSLYSKFDKTFAGHIHHRSSKGTIQYLGNPFSMTRSDINNQKGIYILDVKNNKTKFIENKYSPVFVKISLEDLFEMTLEEFKSKVKNNFVDILTPIEWSTIFPFSALLDITDTYRKINISIISNSENPTQDDLSEDLSDLDITKLTKQFITNLAYDNKLKNLITKYIKNLQQRILHHEGTEE